MSDVIQIMVLSLGVFTGLCYVVLLLFYCYGWIQTPYYNSTELLNPSTISVIIAARNEEVSIINCLQSVLKQTYSKECYEIIVIDDHSTDTTFQLISKLAQVNKNIKILQLNSKDTGKKNAIEFGIQSANGDIIVTTDADCIMEERWLETMVSYLIISDSKMVVGPVAYYKEKTLLEKFQSLELVALITSGAASLYFNKAIMCNGANLAYYKKTFYEVGGYEELKSIASGDDVLLLYKIKKMFPGKISFVKSKEAMVFTKAKNTLNEFYHQRKRWASKGFVVLNVETKLVAITVVAFNVLILIMLALSGLYLVGVPVHSYFIVASFILLVIKWVIDFLLLFLAAPFFNKKDFFIYFLPEQVFYSLYILIVLVFGSFGNYKWKGRKIKL